MKAARMRGCPRTGKTRYRSEWDAIDAMARTRKRVSFRGESSSSPPAARVYACPYCEGWHLTSQEKRT